MAHECYVCGQECYCDMEDHGQPQPDDCVHLVHGCPDDDDLEAYEECYDEENAEDCKL